MRGVRGRLGNASVEAGGGRGGIGARHRAASVRGEEDDKGEEVAGPAGGDGPGKWPRWAAGNVSLPLSVFPILLLFSIFCSLI